MTPDQWRRNDIDRACQRMSDEYDARQAARRSRQNQPTDILLSVCVGAVAGLAWAALLLGMIRP